MSKRLLRSVLVAAFSAVVAFGTLNGLDAAQGDGRADSVWSMTVVSAGPVGTDVESGTDDSVWS
ncbi:hypothetical protein GCM10023220_24890 [Streptomyces ziwulingensis]|uniref:Uncharacterized protein n=1 Tax=Streptomyces ziwulingensis TaxID=1045501 RepID=A0ABP9BKD3_9ACTN